MSTFSYPIAIAATLEGPFQRIEAVVDTGAFYAWVPGAALKRLGLEPSGRPRFVLADGSRIDRDITDVAMRINGETRYAIGVFGDEGTQPLLGAVALEQFALAVDPVNKRLVPIPELPLLEIG